MIYSFDYVKIKKFWEKIFVINIINKGLVFGIYMEFLLISKKIYYLMEKWVRNRYFIKK